MYTECPNCHTTFRVSSAQLKVAGGKARCGRCDTVFNAVDSLMDDIPGRSQAVAATQQTDFLSAPVDTPDLEQALSEVDIPGMDEGLEDIADAPGGMDDMGMDDDIAPALDETIVDEDLFSTPAMENVEGEMLADGLDMGDQPGEGFDGIDLDGDLSAADLDDDIADGLGDDLGDMPEEEPEALLDGEEDFGLDDDQDLADLGGELGVDLDAPDDPNLESGGLDLADSEIELGDAPAAGRDPLLEDDGFDLNTELSEVGSEGTDFRDRRESANDYVMRELGENRSKGRSVFITMLWTVLIAVLLIVLLGQFLYFKRADLVQYPQARLAIEKMCEMIGEYVQCDVPEPRDLAAIQLLERDVRSHPTTKGALLISATVLSGAEFTQPYPKLALTFSDINQKTIARRLFSPTEYLRDDVDIASGMQPEVPIRVILEIVDPGPEAVNFEFEFE